VATFAGLSITGTVGDRTLSFASTLPTVTSGTVTLTAGAATQLTFTTQPSGAVNGVAFTTQPVLQLRDASSNAVSQAGVSVAAAIASGGGTLGGTTPVLTDASGVATFAGLSITGTVGDRTLSFASTLPTVTSGTVTLTAGAASAATSTVSASPESIAADGIAISTITVTALDASSNPIAGATVILSATNTGTGNTLTQPAVTGANGVAAGTLASTVAEVKTVTATINDVLITQIATVTVGP
jgi:hypothetical protein